MKTLKLILDYTIALLPPIGTFMMTFYTFSCALGYELPILEILFGPSALFTILLMIMAWRDHHTKFYNLCLLYILVVQLCIHYQRQIGFDYYVQPIRWIMVGIGTMLLGYFVSNYDSYISHNIHHEAPDDSVNPQQPSMTPEQVQHIIEPLADAVSGISDRLDELEHSEHDVVPSQPFSVIRPNDE